MLDRERRGTRDTRRTTWSVENVGIAAGRDVAADRERNSSRGEPDSRGAEVLRSVR